MKNYKVAMVITDSFHSDIEGKNYKFGTPNKLNKTSKPLILFYFVQDYKRTWDEANPLNYDDPQLKNDAIVTKIESAGDVLNISLFDYESLDETELRFEVGKETSISKVVDENDHTKEYKFIPTKIVVDDSLEKGSKVYDELMELWNNYYIKNSKEGEKIPKVAENVENLAAEGHSHNKSSYKKCAECSDSVFELEEEICFECSSFGAEYEKTDDERILGIHNGNGNKVGTVSIEDVSDNKDKVFISIDGYNEEDEHGWHPMIWDGVIPESPFNAETFNAYSQESRIQNLIDKLYDDREIALNKLLKINNPSLQNLISKNALLRDRVGDMTLAEWSQVQNQLKYTPSGRIRTFGAETFEDDGWVKSTASERIGGYPSFLRKKQFHFEKEFTMPPYPNTLKIDVDGYFTGISYEDEDESYFNTPKFIKERKEFVKIYTDSKLQEILEKYTMSKVKEYYEEIADDWVFGEREEEEIEEEVGESVLSDWGLTDEEIAEYKQEMAEEQAQEKAQKMADLEEERNSHIEYCDNYFKKQMNRYMSDWNNSWMVEETNGQGQFMGHISPTFLPTHIKFVDETRGITLYEYNQGGDILSYDAETFESESSKKPHSVTISRSSNSEKKLMAVFEDSEGKKIKTTHFGQRGASDYTKHGDKERMQRYLERHGGGTTTSTKEDWKDPTTAGALSRWILWNKPSLSASFSDYKSRFGLKGTLNVSKSAEERKCKSCEKPATTVVQEGSFCYECLPINLGAENQPLCANKPCVRIANGTDGIGFCMPCEDDASNNRLIKEATEWVGLSAETFEANAKTGNKVYIITRRCEDYSAYRELDVAGFGSLTEARKKFNILFKEAKKQDYADYTIADAKYYMSWGEFWGIMSFNDGEMIYELREVIVGDKGDFYFDAEGEINE